SRSAKLSRSRAGRLRVPTRPQALTPGAARRAGGTCREGLESWVASQNTRVRPAMPSGFTKLFTADLARLGREHPEISLQLLTGGGAGDLKNGEPGLRRHGHQRQRGRRGLWAA